MPGGRVLLLGALLVVIDRLLHVLRILWRPRDLEHGAGEAVDVSAKSAAMNRITIPTEASMYCNPTFAEPLGMCDGSQSSAAAGSALGLLWLRHACCRSHASTVVPATLYLCLMFVSEATRDETACCTSGGRCAPQGEMPEHLVFAGRRPLPFTQFLTVFDCEKAHRDIGRSLLTSTMVLPLCGLLEVTSCSRCTSTTSAMMMVPVVTPDLHGLRRVEEFGVLHHVSAKLITAPFATAPTPFNGTPISKGITRARETAERRLRFWQQERTGGEPTSLLPGPLLWIQQPVPHAWPYRARDRGRHLLAGIDHREHACSELVTEVEIYRRGLNKEGALVHDIVC